MALARVFLSEEAMKKRYVEKLWNLSVLRKRETDMKLLICILVLFVVLFLFLFLREMDKRKQEMLKQKDIDKMLTKYIADNIDMEKKLSDMQYDYEKQQDMAEEVRKIQEQIRALKHDMKNHTLVILSYLEENRVKEAKDYAGEILDKLNMNAQECLMVGNDVDEDMSTADIGMETYLVTDYIENKHNKDYSMYRQGTFEEFYEFAKALPSVE